jgi:hypothetical protein
MMTMDADRFRTCMEAVDWSLRGLGRLLNVNLATVQRWASGEQDVPVHIAAWLETLAQAHERNPPPERD